MISHHEAYDAARLRARLRLDNAHVYARGVAVAFGLLSPEYAIAARVVEHEQRALIATYCDPIPPQGGAFAPSVHSDEAREIATENGAAHKVGRGARGRAG